MKVNVTIPDGPFADALLEEAGERYRTAANLCVDYVRTALNKRGYEIPKLDRRRRKGLDARFIGRRIAK